MGKYFSNFSDLEVKEKDPGADSSDTRDGWFHHNVEGISGATILGDGTVAMILDMGGIGLLTDNPSNRPKVTFEYEQAA